MMDNSIVEYDADTRHILVLNRTLKLEDQLRGAIRLKQFSLRTEETYVGWYRHQVLWHGRRLPAEEGAAEVDIAVAATEAGLGEASQQGDTTQSSVGQSQSLPDRADLRPLILPSGLCCPASNSSTVPGGPKGHPPSAQPIGLGRCTGRTVVCRTAITDAASTRGIAPRWGAVLMRGLPRPLDGAEGSRAVGPERAGGEPDPDPVLQFGRRIGQIGRFGGQTCAVLTKSRSPEPSGSKS